MRKIILTIAGCVVVLVCAVGFHLWQSEGKLAAGVAIANFDGVNVYDNGLLFSRSHGRHYADDGYYYGQKWQCVEFVKRYLYQVKGHRMPDAMGNAIDFFDPNVPQGGLNRRRGMLQFAQGGAEPPRKGDLVVFGGAMGYGHVGIVVATGDGFIEVAQQNKAPVRDHLSLVHTTDGYKLEAGLPPLGWLRVPAAGSRQGLRALPRRGE